MTQRSSLRATTRLLAAALVISPLLAACAGGSGVKKDTRYVARDVNTLYRAAQERLDRGNYQVAAALFDEVERQHPYSPWARRAQLMSSFSYYMDREYTPAIEAAQRFLSIHPGNKDAPYAYYLIGLSYYEQISDVTRDQKITEQAKNALGEGIRRYPDSRYAADAGLQSNLGQDHPAGREVEIGRFYARNPTWPAASSPS
ncbi:MAG: outer membrane protein assembly factor BamD, partial [Sphingopyxis sp.]|nr:outer membrane protein assembly factor BamD [Sphingopyxis sp.]